MKQITTHLFIYRIHCNCWGIMRILRLNLENYHDNRMRELRTQVFNVIHLKLIKLRLDTKRERLFVNL